MKKLLILILVFLLAFSISACRSRDIDELKTMISSMDLDYADEEYSGEDYEGIEIAGRGSIIMYEPDFNILSTLYAAEKKLARLEFEITESSNEKSVYITYLALGYIDQINEIYISHEYSSTEIDGYRIDMSSEEWIKAVSHYSAETILKILIDLEIIIKE
jgi:hypothetical protein